MTEIRAGLTTFATMAYIIAVNVGGGALIYCTGEKPSNHTQASILADTGFDCVCNQPKIDQQGIRKNEEEYRACHNGPPNHLPYESQIGH